MREALSCFRKSIPQRTAALECIGVVESYLSPSWAWKQAREIHALQEQQALKSRDFPGSDGLKLTKLCLPQALQVLSI